MELMTDYAYREKKISKFKDLSIYYLKLNTAGKGMKMNRASDN